MAERQRQQREHVREKMKPLFKKLLKRGKQAWA
jgi:hypothetical protein